MYFLLKMGTFHGDIIMSVHKRVTEQLDRMSQEVSKRIVSGLTPIIYSHV